MDCFQNKNMLIKYNRIIIIYRIRKFWGIRNYSFSLRNIFENLVVAFQDQIALDILICIKCSFLEVLFSWESILVFVFMLILRLNIFIVNVMHTTFDQPIKKVKAVTWQLGQVESLNIIEFMRTAPGEV